MQLQTLHTKRTNHSLSQLLRAFGIVFSNAITDFSTAFSQSNLSNLAKHVISKRNLMDFVAITVVFAVALGHLFNKGVDFWLKCLHRKVNGF